MRRYETIFIVDPDLSDEQQDPVFERLTDLINQHKGIFVKLDRWGTKKLAYEIKKKSRGCYVRLDYCGNGLLVDEIERFFRIDDRILKYMTVLTKTAVDVEKIKEEIAISEKTELQMPQDFEIKAEQNHFEVPEPEPVQTETELSENDREV